MELMDERNVLDITPLFFEAERTLYEWIVYEDEKVRNVLLAKVSFEEGKLIEIRRFPFSMATSPVLDQRSGLLYTIASEYSLGQNATNIQIDIRTGEIGELPASKTPAVSLQDWAQIHSGFSEEDDTVLFLAPVGDASSSTTAWFVVEWTPSDGGVRVRRSSFLSSMRLDSAMYDSRSNDFIVSMSTPAGEGTLARVCAQTGDIGDQVSLKERLLQLSVFA